MKKFLSEKNLPIKVAEQKISETKEEEDSFDNSVISEKQNEAEEDKLDLDFFKDLSMTSSDLYTNVVWNLMGKINEIKKQLEAEIKNNKYSNSDLFFIIDVLKSYYIFLNTSDTEHSIEVEISVEEKLDEMDSIEELLEIIREKSSSFLIKEIIDNSYSYLFNLWTTEEKKVFLEDAIRSKTLNDYDLSIIKEEDLVEFNLETLAYLDKDQIDYYFKVYVDYIDDNYDPNYEFTLKNKKFRHLFHSEKLRKTGPFPTDINFNDDYDDFPKEDIGEEIYNYGFRCGEAYYYIYSQVSPKYGIVYNPRGSVDQFFKLGENKELSVYEILVDEGILSKEDPKIQEKCIAYKWLLMPETRIKIENEFNINLKDLEISVQIEILYFLFNAEEDTINRASVFLKKYGIKGGRTFLSCSEYSLENQKKDFGDIILELGEKLQPEQAEILFSKYNEIINEIDEILEMTKKFNKESSPETKDKIKENLLRSAKDLLFNFHQRLNRGEDVGDTEKELEAIKSDVILFASTFKTISESGENIDFKEISQTVMETKKPAELSPTEKEEMVRIFLANREEGYSENLLREVFDDFDESINPNDDSPKANADFTILKYNDQIVSFLRLEPRGDDRLYAAAFNARPETKGFKIGNTMIKEVIERAAEERTIEAIAYSGKPELLKFYQKFFGFNPIGEIEIAGEKFIKIEKARKSAKEDELELVA